MKESKYKNIIIFLCFILTISIVLNVIYLIPVKEKSNENENNNLEIGFIMDGKVIGMDEINNSPYVNVNNLKQSYKYNLERDYLVYKFLELETDFDYNVILEANKELEKDVLIGVVINELLVNYFDLVLKDTNLLKEYYDKDSIRYSAKYISTSSLDKDTVNEIKKSGYNSEVLKDVSVSSLKESFIFEDGSPIKGNFVYEGDNYLVVVSEKSKADFKELERELKINYTRNLVYGEKWYNDMLKKYNINISE